MMSELILKRETFCLQLKRTEKERIFKSKRQKIYPKEQLLELIKSKDQDSIIKLVNVSEGSSKQINELLEMGGIEYFSDLLNSSEKELAIIGLSNLYSQNSVQASMKDLILFETIVNEVHLYQNIEQLVQRLRFLNIIALYCTDLSRLEEEQRIKDKLYQVFSYYQNKYPQIFKIQEECFKGFLSLASVQFVQNEIIQLCCDNFNKGIDQIIIQLLYYTIDDNVEFIAILNRSTFIQQCPHHLKIIDRQKYILSILYYYSQYYVERIISNNELVEQIQVIQNSNRHQRLILLLHYQMLLKCPRALFMKILKEFDVINNLKFLLETFKYAEQILLVIALLKQTKQNLIEELMPYLENLFLKQEVNERIAQKLQLILG
ncbi:unnamed protein product (macronuclear) [Paramecium tetraurelia]|uniref:Chromosome undetermined scaffold_1, whole genome shotgun sequence n=1 Tax=Paramecium tetraurelia TaxID=5888 RepID=Q6BFX9_PARTE|nr:hypothetical protein [Paramecium tetraurelia strain d4-2]XP_001423235.1 uncharacterized protein GSPATT00000272001 [Paramecium tetraurelia]CAH03441.1 hypothetical protein PTMB.243c [Paramecium tetraurelia]CAK55837.1 unnamed protein product [Paramecium tetraurelia]|eukprot:XP_001423235.1 hypothetical protein (macronuclear) [Paramecium tetraurelia strain d4-2]